MILSKEKWVLPVLPTVKFQRTKLLHSPDLTHQRKLDALVKFLPLITLEKKKLILLKLGKLLCSQDSTMLRLEIPSSQTKEEVKMLQTHSPQLLLNNLLFVSLSELTNHLLQDVRVNSLPLE